MDIYEDSMPFRFTPDGLDESTIDALIEETNAGISDDVPPSVPMDVPTRRPVSRRAVKRSTSGKAA